MAAIIKNRVLLYWVLLALLCACLLVDCEKKKSKKPKGPPKPDRSHFEECEDDDDCPDSRFHCTREHMFEIDAKSRCFPKRCSKLEECPVPMVCKFDKNTCDFDLPADLLEKLEL